ncbi:MAG: hypothetical protein JSW61_14660 [Candidatus Thorarchaeota archaeon]|nr:MAG: hypothetical protein JSW61_14660 [Candidatus Thorarchaeota archaeon]
MLNRVFLRGMITSTLILILALGVCLPNHGITMTQGEPGRCILLSQSQNDLSNLSVAIYESYYSSTDARVRESRTALISMFNWMNATVTVINRTHILDGALFAFELLVIPEGLGPFIENNLGEEAEEMIREWLSLGGSFIGVRGSSTIAVTDSFFEGREEQYDLGLVNGTTIGMPEIGHTLVTDIEVNRECTGPDLSDMPEAMSVLFRTGRYFVPDEGQELICIANYTFNNQPAMVAARYGDGNLFLSSPHFEYEENSDRDGTDYMDRYDDPDSEWPFLLRICHWLIADSSTVQNVTTWGETTTTTGDLEFPTEAIFLAGGIGVAVIIVLLAYLRRRQ